MQVQNMRYNSEDRYYSKHDSSKKHDSTKRLRRHRKMKPSTEAIRYQTAEAIVTSNPRNECSIFQRSPRVIQTERDFKKHNREEVVVTGIVYFPGFRDSYVIRFVSKHSVELARELTIGTRIYIDMGYFNHRPGRRNSEFWVKSFSLEQPSVTL
jgi:hypothetical protein